MNPRALLILAALLAAPAWPQAPSFDLKGDALKKIVHDIASSQSVPVQLSQDLPAKRDSAPTIRFVPPEKPAVAKPAAPPPARSSSPAPDGILGVVVDTFIDSLLDVQHDEVTQEQYEAWRACQARDEKCLLPPAPVPRSKLELRRE